MLRTRAIPPLPIKIFISFLGILTLLVVAAPDPAKAGPLGFLFGGGKGERQAVQDRSSRQTVSFSPAYEPGAIVVSFTDRRLYFVTRRGEAFSYLIGIPTGDARWSGTSVVSEKKVNPRWIPTADMRAKDPSLPLEVAGGHPRNPLGVRALYLGETMYRIHGTDAPQTVGQEVSNGCVRLYNTDIIDLYGRASIGARVIVTWDSFRGVASPRRDSTYAPPARFAGNGASYAGERGAAAGSGTGWQTSVSTSR